MDTKRFLSAAEVAEYLGVSESMAYKVIQKLNAELRARGFITIAGRVSRTFFEEKIYSSQREVG